jgi:hypothetical protein
MKSILILLSSLLFNAGVATVNADPAAAAKAITSSIQTLEKVQPSTCDGCCPEWLCRLLCSIVGPGCCQPGAGTGQGCGTAPACCGPDCCGR